MVSIANSIVVDIVSIILLRNLESKVNASKDFIEQVFWNDSIGHPLGVIHLTVETLSKWGKI